MENLSSKSSALDVAMIQECEAQIMLLSLDDEKKVEE
jgi:hypothetical protein